MKVKLNLKLAALCAILSAMLVVPAWAQEKGDMAEHFKQMRTQMIKQLKLAPDKEKAMLAVEDKYASQRQQTTAGLKKTKEDLKTALAAATPDEAKVKELVSSLTSSMDALFNSYKSQREEELALMTPVEQGKYLMAMMKMREEMMGKKKGPEKQK